MLLSQTMMALKEKKEMDDLFKKAQKPWVKVLTKVNKTKQDYHNACKSERSAANQERNAGADNALSPEQVRRQHSSILPSFRPPRFLSCLPLPVAVLNRIETLLG